MALAPFSADTLATISVIERHSARSWPALYVTQHHGWELRLSPALASRRVNSLNAVTPEAGRFPSVLADAASLCAKRGVKFHIRVLPLAGNEASEHLESLGISGAAETTVKSVSLDREFPVDPRVTIATSMTDEWLDTYLAAEWHADGEREVIKAALVSVQMPQAFAIAYDGGIPCAVGRGVVENGWLGIYQIATLPDARRRGFGNGVMTALLKWGKSLTAQNAYLQVVSANGPARALYNALGFQPLYTYDYWTVPLI